MSTVNIKFLSNHDFILREFFQFAYAEKTFTDCVLYCQCDDRAVSSLIDENGTMCYKEFHCHRIILSAYSDYFRQCFLAPGSKNACFLMDLNPKILNYIIKLIYNGYVEIPELDKGYFLYAATKLGLKQTLLGEVADKSIDSSTHLKRRLTLEDVSNPLQQAARQYKIINVASMDEDKGLQIGHNAYASVDTMHLGKMGMETNAQPSMSTTPPMAESNETTYPCPECSKKYSYKISLNKHMKNAHPNS